MDNAGDLHVLSRPELEDEGFDADFAVDASAAIEMLQHTGYAPSSLTLDGRDETRLFNPLIQLIVVTSRSPNVCRALLHDPI